MERTREMVCSPHRGDPVFYRVSRGEGTQISHRSRTDLGEITLTLLKNEQIGSKMSKRAHK